MTNKTERILSVNGIKAAVDYYCVGIKEDEVTTSKVTIDKLVFRNLYRTTAITLILKVTLGRGL